MIQHMVETASATPDDKRRASGCLRWTAILVLACVLIGGVVAWKFFDLARDAAVWLRDLPTRMVRQEITQSFRESVTSIASTNGDILEVATLHTDETITSYDMKTILNDAVYLGTTISEIRTPVVYRYHIRLSDEWRLSVEDRRCIVHAPVMRASLPPAIRTEGMEKKSAAGWLRFNAAENLAELEKSLTLTLEKRAGNKAHLDLVREAARKSVGEFVKKWLLKDGQATTGEVKSITVIFPDEVKADDEPLTVPPTLEVP